MKLVPRKKGHHVDRESAQSWLESFSPRSSLPLAGRTAYYVVDRVQLCLPILKIENVGNMAGVDIFDIYLVS